MQEKYKEPCNDYRAGSVESTVEGITDPDTIREVQEALNGLGYECGSPDGIIGSATIAAIMAYQAENGLRKNGTVTEELVEELKISGTVENLTETEADLEGTDYVLNKRSKKFHYPSCKSVDDMSEKNKQFYHGTREELIDVMKYDPCHNCNP